MTIAALSNSQLNINHQLNAYNEKNNNNRFKKLRSRVYVVEKQENNKNTDNNEKTENSFNTEN